MPQASLHARKVNVFTGARYIIWSGAWSPTRSNISEGVRRVLTGRYLKGSLRTTATLGLDNKGQRKLILRGALLELLVHRTLMTKKYKGSWNGGIYAMGVPPSILPLQWGCRVWGTPHIVTAVFSTLAGFILETSYRKAISTCFLLC